MKEKNNPFSGIAKLLISLGLVMIIAKLDLFKMGPISDYMTWEMLLIFFGFFNLLNLDLIASLGLFAVGFWFLMPEMGFQLSPFYKEIYWPALMVLVGIAFMIRPFTRSLK